MTIDFKQYNATFYEEEQKSSLLAASRIVPKVLEYIDIESVLDVGCGVGGFLKLFKESGAKDVLGLDGDYLSPAQLLIPESAFRAFDLSKPVNLDMHFDLVVSLEVAEHLNSENAEIFIDTLCRHGDTILFSAAVPGQGGTNHVNEQLASYWARKFIARGYKPADVLRPLIWDSAEIDYWYRQNLIFYVNDKGLHHNPRLKAALEVPAPPIIDAIHPVGFLDKVSTLTVLRKMETDLTSDVENLRNDVRVLREAEKNLLHDVSVLRESEANFLRDISVLRSSEAQYETRKQALAAQVDQLQSDLAKVSTSLAEAETARVKLEVREDYMRADIDRMRQHIDDLQGSEKDARNELASYKVAAAVHENSNTYLKGTISHLETAHTNTQRMLLEKEKELAELGIQINAHVKHITEMQTNAEQLLAEKERLVAEKSELLNERQQFEQVISNLELEQAHLASERNDLRIEARRLEAVLADLENENNRLTQELHEVIAAHSSELSELADNHAAELSGLTVEHDREIDVLTGRIEYLLQADRDSAERETGLRRQLDAAYETVRGEEQRARHTMGLANAIGELQEEIYRLSNSLSEKEQRIQLETDIVHGYEKAIADIIARRNLDIQQERREAMRRLHFMNRSAKFLRAVRTGINMDKIKHMVSRLLRSPLPKRARELSHITIINGCPEGESKRYRIENIITALRPMGMRADVFLEGDCAAAQRKLRNSDMLLIFRTRYNDGIGELISEARRLNIPVVFDVDDLVFEVESVNYIGAVQGLTEEQKVFHRNEVQKFRQTLDLCDAAIATTEFLAGRLRDTGIEAFVVPNTINAAQMQIGREYAERFARNAGEIVTLGYFSGSPTHNKDFMEAADALAQVLRENPNLQFHLVGHLVLDARFDLFADRIFRHEFMPYLDMLRFMGTMDFVMAPLELDNPFSQGKSELKIFEAAVVQVPCVASATHAYSDVITDRQNGMLCRSRADWYQALSLLARDTSARHRMGAAAFREIVPMFDIEKCAANIAATYRRAAQAARGDRKEPGRREDVRDIRASGLFDTFWYLKSYEDVRTAKANPIIHYLLHGAGEGRNPGPEFDTRYYLTSNPDVAQAGINPLVHFVRYGRKEGRRPLPAFSRESSPKVAAHVEPEKTIAPVLTESIVAAPSHASSGDLRNQILAEILESGEFDDVWYRSTYSYTGSDAVAHYLDFGAELGYHPGPEFDADYYRDTAMADDRSGNPLLHYLRKGRVTGATRRPPLTMRGSYTLIFVNGGRVDQDVSKRLVHLYQGATQKGYSAALINIQDIGAIERQGVDVDVVVLSHCGYSEGSGVARFLNYARHKSIKVVADFETLSFDANLVCDQILPIEAGQADMLAVTANYRRMLMAADLVSVPTAAMASHVEAMGRDVAVVSASLYDEPFWWYKGELNGDVCLALNAPDLVGGLAECREAIISVLQASPKVRLRILGQVTLGDEWALVLGQIDIVPVSEYGIGQELRHCHINLVPISAANPVAMAASEIYWLEASALGIPTIASANKVYQSVISNAEDGFLASSVNDWKNILEQLIRDPKLRNSIGGRARQKAQTDYSVSTVVASMARHFGLTRVAAKVDRGVKPGCLHIAWVIPGLIIGGGGHRNILRAAYFLNQFGHKVSLYFTDAPGSAGKLRALVNEHFYPLDCDMYVYDGDIEPADVIFATHWTTVAPALKARDKCKEVIYFVQDFEPIFTPMGSDYVRAETTYRQGLYCITSGAWCEYFLKRDFGAEADHFRFPVDRETYFPRNVTASMAPKITFFAKPEMPRRCFELGVLALREVNRLRPDIEIVFFGSRHAGEMSYDFPVTVLSLVPTLDDLAVLYSQSTVGLVFSTSNPSLIPYEMMACGLPVVDLDRGNNEVNYDNSRDIALLANPDPEVMAREIIALIDHPEELSARRAKGLEFIDAFPSEEEMAKRVEMLIMQRMERHKPAVEPKRARDKIRT